MRKFIVLYFLLGLTLLLSGCVVRTYQVTKDRIDQDLTAGNRGYLQGQAPAPAGERKSTRDIRVVEVELRSPVKFEKGAPAKAKLSGRTEDTEDWGNRGYLTQGQESGALEYGPEVRMEEYTVQKGETLQKISKKFYGTTKKWNKIYGANRDVLKGPNKIYPGQTIKIPVDALKEPAENLK